MNNAEYDIFIKQRNEYHKQNQYCKKNTCNYYGK